MRKSRTVVKDISEETYSGLSGDPQHFFSTLDILGIASPAWATAMFVFTRPSRRSLDVSFFEEAQDFFIWYSRVLIDRKEDMRVASFNRAIGESVWKIFSPPTLIGIDLQTRLR
jgi:hypothetical protein